MKAVFPPKRFLDSIHFLLKRKKGGGGGQQQDGVMYHRYHTIIDHCPITACPKVLYYTYTTAAICILLLLLLLSAYSYI